MTDTPTEAATAAVTPAKAAEYLAYRDSGYDGDLNAWTSLSPRGNVVHLTAYPAQPTNDPDGDEPDRSEAGMPGDPIHFCAAVVPGEHVPLVLNMGRYEAAVREIVDEFAHRLAAVPHRDIPIYLAWMRRRLIELGEQPMDGPPADPETV